ncbi:hypothetical protein Dimus_031027 [Dionaea muscipula]
MGKTKTRKELLASEPWRGDETPAEDQFKDARIKVTNQPGSTPTMHLPRKKTSERKNDTATAAADEPASKIDPEFLYGFRRNYRFVQRVFTIDTIVKPLPPAMAYHVSRNLSFFTRIFTQFFDPKGISNAHKSLGLGAKEED